jgi:hypothetical protein
MYVVKLSLGTHSDDIEESWRKELIHGTHVLGEPVENPTWEEG